MTRGHLFAGPRSRLPHGHFSAFPSSLQRPPVGPHALNFLRVPNATNAVRCNCQSGYTFYPPSPRRACPHALQWSLMVVVQDGYWMRGVETLFGYRDLLLFQCF